MDDSLTIEFLGYTIIALAVFPVIIDYIRYRRMIFDNPLLIPFALLALFMGFRLIFLSSPGSWGLFQNLIGEMDPVPVFEQIGYYCISVMIAMMAGYFFVVKPNLKTPGISMQWSKAHGEGLARIGFFGMAFLTMVFLLLGAYSTSRMRGGGGNFSNTSGYIYMLEMTKTGLMTLVTIYMIGRLPFKLRNSLFNPTYLILLIAFIIYVKTSFSTQGRFVLVAPMVAFGIILLRFNPTSKKLQSFMVLSFLMALFLFNLAGALRIAAEEGERGNELTYENIYRWYTERISSADDFNGVEGMAFVMKNFNDQEGYLWGKSYAAVLWHWWPRKFVKEYFNIDKPYTVGIHLKGVFLADSNRLSEELDRSKTLGFSSTFIGQNYENFGFVGGVIFALFQGIALALIYNWVTARYFSINVQTVYACFLASMPALARGGAIAIDLANAFMGYLPVIVVLLFFKGKGSWLPQSSRLEEAGSDTDVVQTGQLQIMPPPEFSPQPGNQPIPHGDPVQQGPISHVRNISYPKRTMNPPTPNKATQE